jgi:hypothetical protein
MTRSWPMWSIWDEDYVAESLKSKEGKDKASETAKLPTKNYAPLCVVLGPTKKRHTSNHFTTFTGESIVRSHSHIVRERAIIVNHRAVRRNHRLRERSARRVIRVANHRIWAIELPQPVLQTRFGVRILVRGEERQAVAKDRRTISRGRCGRWIRRHGDLGHSMPVWGSICLVTNGGVGEGREGNWLGRSGEP